MTIQPIQPYDRSLGRPNISIGYYGAEADNSNVGYGSARGFGYVWEHGYLKL